MQGIISKKKKVGRLTYPDFKTTELQYSGEFSRIELRF